MRVGVNNMKIVQKTERVAEEAAKLFEQGYGYKAVSTELGVNRETVRDWSYTWRALGTEEFLKDVETTDLIRTRYPKDLKLAVVKDRLAGMPVIDVMIKYRIRNRNRIKNWVHQYRDLVE